MSPTNPPSPSESRRFDAVEAAVYRHWVGAVDLRHRLHRIPELQFEEHRTAATIRAELDVLGLEHFDGVPGAPTATVAILGDMKKTCVALRADIDALPIQENSGVPYASENPGKMHACGHDGHAATLLGAAAVLKGMEERLPVCVKFIWQPAEEGGGGAQRLVRAGVLGDQMGPKAAAVFGLHGWPGLAIGEIASKSGPLLAAMDNFRITFVGAGCHAAYPQNGIDPILPAASAVLDLQQVGQPRSGSDRAGRCDRRDPARRRSHECHPRLRHPRRHRSNPWQRRQVECPPAHGAALRRHCCRRQVPTSIRVARRLSRNGQRLGHD